jgi:hypothetical protein
LFSCKGTRFAGGSFSTSDASESFKSNLGMVSELLGRNRFFVWYIPFGVKGFTLAVGFSGLGLVAIRGLSLNSLPLRAGVVADFCMMVLGVRGLSNRRKALTFLYGGLNEGFCPGVFNRYFMLSLGEGLRKLSLDSSKDNSHPDEESRSLGDSDSTVISGVNRRINDIVHMH